MTITVLTQTGRAACRWVTKTLDAEGLRYSLREDPAAEDLLVGIYQQRRPGTHARHASRRRRGVRTAGAGAPARAAPGGRGVSETIRRLAPCGGVFITRPGAAQLRGVTRRRIDTLIQSQVLPVYMVCGHVMVLEADVLALNLPPVKPPDGYVTRHAAAARLGSAHRAVGLMVARGDLPAETINGRIHIRANDMRAAAQPAE